MKHFTFILLLILSSSLFSQTNFSISGTVYDTNSTIVDNGDLLLISKNNGKILTYTFIENGKFYFDAIKQGTYILKIHAISYEEFSQEIILNNNIDLQFSLTPKHNLLNEVEITTRKRLIQNKKGNILINVENSIFSAEPTTTNLLAKLPKLQVNETQETLEIIGKGTPLIYIDNQQVPFQMLNTLQVDDIKTIEIINNPSVKYEANANAVLLITLKKNTSNELKILLRETTAFKRFFNNYISSYVSFKKNKNEIKLSIAYNAMNVWERNNTSYAIPSENIVSNHVITSVTNRKQAVFNGGFYHQINDKDYFSINSNTQAQKEPFSFNTITNYSEDNMLDTIDTSTNDLGSRYFTTTSLNYQKQFKNTDILFFGAQHVFYVKKITNNITNTSNDQTFDVTRTQNFSIDSYIAKINYEKKFSENSTLESGISFLKTKTGNDNNSIIYNFIEENKAFYLQLSSKLFKKLNYSLGFRVEGNTTLGYFTDRKDDRSYRKNTFLFPKFNIHIPFKKEQSLTLNYSKNIARPAFSSLSNTAAYVNPYIEFTGNLNLKNAVTDELSLHYSFNKKAITLEYSYTKNSIKPFTFNYNPSNQTTTILPLNFTERTNIRLEANIPISYGLWSSENSLNFLYSRFVDHHSIETNLKPYLYYYSNQTFSINNITSFNLNLWGTTLKGEGPFSTLPVFTMNASFQKKFKNIDLTLSYNDIFNTLEFSENHMLPNINGNTLFFTDVNAFSLALKYNFGKIRKSNYKNKTVSNTRRIR
ncbi:outer membrane beta-barrel protein [Tenacibaculum agarivorans]|uniref:outer membrane beta-barrel protein n=1 Tax=Tenacibaculum agarivorans TaxID=1908389 RepID=UPI00094BB5AD|nr:outer membrane beta-barrel protein [Tenacibaculum agarivorans]